LRTNGKDVASIALELDWVATKMGGSGAPDSLDDGPLTQIWLASSMDSQVLRSGEYYYHKQPQKIYPDSRNHEIQQVFLEKCEQISGIKLPS
jgi:hypothetical protein